TRVFAKLRPASTKKASREKQDGRQYGTATWTVTTPRAPTICKRLRYRDRCGDSTNALMEKSLVDVRGMNNTVNPGAGRRGNPRENLFMTRPTPSPSFVSGICHSGVPKLSLSARRRA